MNGARRLIGTCTDTLIKTQKKVDSVAHSSTAATYVGISALPRSINIKSACAVYFESFSAYMCMARPVLHVKRFNFTAKHLRDFTNGIALSQY